MTSREDMLRVVDEVVGPDRSTYESWTDYSNWRVADDPPRQEWIIDGRIPLGHTCLFAGDGGTGKSTIALHAAAAAASPIRNDWLGAMVAPGPAFFIDAEERIDAIHRRLHSICKYYQCDFPDLIQGGLHLLPLADKDAVLAATDSKTNRVIPSSFYNWLLKEAASVQPKLIVLASSANVYAGSEIDRSQVAQFTSLINALGAAANGATMLIAHPSRAGMQDSTNYSGSTQWNNGPRARMSLTYLSKTENGSPRLLEFPKNQYGTNAQSVTLEWRDGMFLPTATPSEVEKAARTDKVEQLTVDGLRRAHGEGQNISPSPTANNSATARLLPEREFQAAHVTKDEIRDCIRRLLDSGRITKERYGAPSDNTWRLTVP